MIIETNRFFPAIFQLKATNNLKSLRKLPSSCLSLRLPSQQRLYPSLYLSPLTFPYRSEILINDEEILEWEKKLQKLWKSQVN
jgi:3-methyladenine DNA glycosylase AlkC